MTAAQPDDAREMGAVFGQCRERSAPDAEISVDEGLVRALLEEQHPDLAGLALMDMGEGWDNRLFRLGSGLIVRLPRRAVAVPLIGNEQRWLPLVSARLPMPVPELRRIGRPGCGFPWPWSITSWLPGVTALHATADDPIASAESLGRFLRALHRPAPDDAPHNPWRSVPLAARAGRLRQHLQRLDGRVDAMAVLQVWERALAENRGPDRLCGFMATFIQETCS